MSLNEFQLHPMTPMAVKLYSSLNFNKFRLHIIDKIPNTKRYSSLSVSDDQEHICIVYNFMQFDWQN